RADLGLLEADRLTLGRREDHLARPVRQTHPDHLVALLERDRDQARGPGRRILHQVGLLDEAAPSGEDEIAALLELPHRQERRQLLLRLEAEEVRDAAAARGTTGLRHLVYLEPVDLSA